METWRIDVEAATAVLDPPEAPALEPGIHRGVPMLDYLRLPYMSGSRLDVFRRSPLQYQHSLTAEPRVTPALERGTALHLALLEPGEFEGRYAVIGECEGRFNNGKDCTYQGSFWRDGQSFCKRHDPHDGAPMDPDVEVIAQVEMDKVLGMRDAILHRDTPGAQRARSMFEGEGDFEVTVVFDDPETGVRCRIRPDRLVRRAGMHTALKTARCAAGYGFQRDAENRGYFRSLALYRRGLRAVGWPYRHTSVLAIEPDPPHDLECWLVDEGTAGAALETADREVSQALHDFVRCQEEDFWPGYNRGEFRLLTRPGWATRDDEEAA